MHRRGQEAAATLSAGDPASGRLCPGAPLGVYVHFPFCSVRCPYCDFAVDTSREIPHDAYAEAVVREENRDYVFLPVEGGYRLHPVTLGAEYEGARVVVSGLSAGARIVVSGGFHLNNERKRRCRHQSKGFMTHDVSPK